MTPEEPAEIETQRDMPRLVAALRASWDREETQARMRSDERAQLRASREELARMTADRDSWRRMYEIVKARADAAEARNG